MPDPIALPEGSLHLADLGFYKQERLNQATADGRYWISRVSCGHTLRLATEPTTAISAVHTFLERHAVGAEVHTDVVLGGADHEHPLAARLDGLHHERPRRRITPEADRRIVSFALADRVAVQALEEFFGVGQADPKKERRLESGRVVRAVAWGRDCRMVRGDLWAP